MSRPFFAQGLADGTYRGWLILNEAEAVVAGGGVVLLRHDPGPRDPSEWHPVVVNVFTEPSHRKRRLARRLLEIIIDWARSQGFRLLHLHASAAARPLYTSLGFEATNEMRLDLRRS